MSSFKEIEKSVEVCFRSNINVTPLLHGHYGKGKTQFVEQFAKKHGYTEVISIRLGQLADSGDLTGLPTFEVNELGEKIYTKFIKPNFFPREENAKVIIFLDEVNRAHPDLIQSVFQLIESSGRFGDWVRPEETKVIAACNPAEEEYTVTDFSDKAYQDRFCHLVFSPTEKEVLDYFAKKKYDDTYIDFLKENPEYLEEQNLSNINLDCVKPSRRSNEVMCKLLNEDKINDTLFVTLANGLVGPGIGRAFLQYRKRKFEKITGTDILDNYTKIKGKLTDENKDLIHSAKEDLIKEFYKRFDANELEQSHYANMKAFTQAIHKDLAYSFLLELGSPKENDDGKINDRFKNMFTNELFNQEIALNKDFNEFIKELKQVEAPTETKVETDTNFSSDDIPF